MASGFQSSTDLSLALLRRTVQMDTPFYIFKLPTQKGVELLYFLRGRITHRIGQGQMTDTHATQFFRIFCYNMLIPLITIGITKAHGQIYKRDFIVCCTYFHYFFDPVQGLFTGAVGIAELKSL